jgi:hypothetical protein
MDFLLPKGQISLNISILDSSYLNYYDYSKFSMEEGKVDEYP